MAIYLYLYRYIGSGEREKEKAITVALSIRLLECLENSLDLSRSISLAHVFSFLLWIILFLLPFPIRFGSAAFNLVECVWVDWRGAKMWAKIK